MSAEQTAGWYNSKQFGMWLAIAVPLFVVASMVLQAIQPHYSIALGVGILFNELLEPVLGRLQDWRDAEKEVMQ